MAAQESGEVYILHNCSLRSGLLKIGRTGRTAEERAAELRTTGVPESFTVLYAVRVADARLAERRLHERFEQYRVSSEREFFRIAPRVAIDALLDMSAPLALSQSDKFATRDVMQDLQGRYGTMLRPQLASASVEVTDSECVIVARIGSDTWRRDLTFIGDMDDDEFFAPGMDLDKAVANFLSLDPYSLLYASDNLLDEWAAQLIADVVERNRGTLPMRKVDEMQDSAVKALRIRGQWAEAEFRLTHDLPLSHRQYVVIEEVRGLLRLTSTWSLPLMKISITSDTAGEDSASVLLEVDYIQTLPARESITIGTRPPASKPPTGQARIIASGLNPDGVPFEYSYQLS